MARKESHECGGLRAEYGFLKENGSSILNFIDVERAREAEGYEGA